MNPDETKLKIEGSEALLTGAQTTCTSKGGIITITHSGQNAQYIKAAAAQSEAITEKAKVKAALDVDAVPNDGLMPKAVAPSIASSSVVGGLRPDMSAGLTEVITPIEDSKEVLSSMESNSESILDTIKIKKQKINSGADNLCEPENSSSFMEIRNDVEFEQGVVAIGISEDEINLKGDEIAANILKNLLIKDDYYLYKKSVLSGQIINLETTRNWYKFSDIAPDLKRFFLSKSLSEFNAGQVPDEFTFICESVNYEISKEIKIKVWQIEGLGKYNYLIHDKIAREKIVKQLDLKFDEYIKSDINLYDEPNNNKILNNRVLKKISEVKIINSNYTESKENFLRLKKCLKKEMEKKFDEIYKKDQEKLMEYLTGVPSIS